jgi:hypothetical protein
MPRRSDDQRIAKYNVKVDPVTVTAKVVAQLPNMQANYPAFVNQYVPKMQAVQDVLNTAGVVPMMFGVYYAFAGRLWRLLTVADGEAARAEAAILIALYVARGLTQTVLESIRTEVFNITAPIAP